MPNVEILTGTGDLPPEWNSLVRHALQRISDSEKGWQGPVEIIEVIRLIEGGRSGAAVVEIALRAGGEYRQRVVKIGAAGEMATEYANFHRLRAEYDTAVCAPITEASPGAVNPAVQREGEVEAVVYTHVAGYAGRPRHSVPTLEDLVRQACHDPATVPEVRQVLVRLFTRMATPFHDRWDDCKERSLRDLNPTLGADLVLEAAPVRREPVYAEDVLDGSLGSREFRPGQELRIAASGSREIKIEIRGDAGVALEGRVVQSRFAEQRAKFDSAFTTIAREGDCVVADGVRTADPAGGLRTALTDPRFGRVRGAVHGDLNARNVMCVEHQPLLIDFAKTAEDRPILSDAAWLEISFLRDVFADLCYAELVRLQRFLALDSRIRPLVTDVAELEAILDGQFDGVSQTAFRLLRELRVQGQLVFPFDGAWVDYLAQLHVSAYRAVKWDGQPGSKLRAAHAAAAVATEWLTGENPFSHWEDRPELLRLLTPIVDLSRPDAVTVMTTLVTALDEEHPGADLPGVEEVRDRLVRAQYVEQARELVIELSREHGMFHGTETGGYEDSAVLAGGPGAGKSQLLRELAYRGAIDIAGPGLRAVPLRLPVLVTAADLVPDAAALPVPHEALVLGAAHILLDGLDELSAEDRTRVAERARSLRTLFPRLRLTVAVRNGAWAADAFQLPVIRLELWNETKVSWFLRSQGFSERAADKVAEEILDVHRADGGAPPGFVTMVRTETLAQTSPQPIRYSYEEYFAGDLADEAVTILASLATAAIDTTATVRPAADVTAFIDRGILETDGEGVRFTRLAERDFFAAQALTAGGDFVREHVRAFAWREICLLAARLPSTPDAVVELMAHTVSTADLRFAARLLAFRPTTALAYLPRWKALLTDVSAGAYSHRAAAAALVLTGVPQARQVLGDVLLSPTTAVSTQLEILETLDVELPHQTDLPYEPWLRDVLGTLLTGAHGAETRISALALIRRRGIRGLEVLSADLLRSGEPPVAVAADELLRASGVLLPQDLETIRAKLVSAQLRQVEAQLPALSRSAEIQAAGRLRLRLLERTTDTSELSHRRFSYGVSHAVADRLGEPSPLTAEDLDARVLSAQVDSPLDVLLMAAAAVTSPAGVEHAAALVVELAQVVTADRIEGLAALGHAVTNLDPRRGFEVTRHAARVLRDRDLASRRYWPWATMLAHTSPSLGRLDQFLGEGVAGALEELAKYAPSVDGRYEKVPLGVAACGQVLRSRQGDDGGWALAVAAAGLPEAVPTVLTIASDRAHATAVEKISFGRYGIVEMALQAEILAALGGLARETGEVTEAHRLLREFDTTGLHSSVEAGRLAGLAYLGDCEPLLQAAPGDGGFLDNASRQAIRKWLPGPCSPPGYRDPGAVAARLLGSAAAAGITPGRRSLLEELINGLEQSHGKLLTR